MNLNCLSKFNLENKTAIITGACGLLGREHAIALLEVGATVVLTDINEKSLQITRSELESYSHHSKILAYAMDITNLEAIKNVSHSLDLEAMNIDILINNAAIDPKSSSIENQKQKTRLENFSLEDWNLQINVGLTGAFLCSQIFGTKMAYNGKGGVILNISSDLSVISPDQRLYSVQDLEDNEQPVKPLTYSVIKSGLIGLTRYLSTYWASKNVRCNALSPGGIFANQSDEFVQRITKLIPMNRMASKDEYRGVVQFLCSEASAYLNGQNIVMDGGRSVW